VLPGQKAVWSKAKPMNCSEVLVEQARLTKAQNNATHVFVYQNLVKALPWMTPVREKLEDPSYWGFFLRKKNATGVDATGVLYHDTTSQPVSGDCGKGVQCGEYLWDVRKAPLTITMQCALYARTVQQGLNRMPPGCAMAAAQEWFYADRVLGQRCHRPQDAWHGLAVR